MATETHVEELEHITELDAIIARGKGSPGALIPVLQKTQQLYGYLPRAALQRIAVALEISYSEVAGVVTFYSYFTTVPRGDHTARVCLGTACYVRGGKEVLRELEERLDIKPGDTTEDRRFSLEIGRCFGACGLAPVVMVDDVVHQRVNPNCIGELLAQYADEHAVSDAATEESEEAQT